jgi:hypothetical protein
VVQLSWTALAGVPYQAQYKTDLAQSKWTNLGNTFTATNNLPIITDAIGPNARRFYRVEVVP